LVAQEVSMLRSETPRADQAVWPEARAMPDDLEARHNGRGRVNELPRQPYADDFGAVGQRFSMLLASRIHRGIAWQRNAPRR
jgi:hypothetical protein